MISSIYSQKLSNDTVRCVPISTLRHALVVKQQFDHCQSVLSNCRDSITILTKIITEQDSLIEIKNQKIKIHESNVTHYEEIQKNKDAIIDVYKIKYTKEKTKKIIGYGVGVLGIFLGLFVL